MTVRAAIVVALAALASLPAAAEDAADLTGAWVGEYVCNQGLTGLTLSISQRSIDDAAPEIRAVFVFYEAAANPGVPDGCFEMSGRYDPATGALDFAAGSWIHRPFDYFTVDLEGRIDPAEGRYAGQVLGANCTYFDLRRADGPPARDHACYAPLISQADAPERLTLSAPATKWRVERRAGR